MPTTKPYNPGFKEKARLLREARGKCEMCQRPPVAKLLNMHPDFHKRILTVHHINGNSLDDRDTNLVVLCTSCHLRVETFNRQLLREVIRSQDAFETVGLMLENSERQLFGDTAEVKLKAGGEYEKTKG